MDRKSSPLVIDDHAMNVIFDIATRLFLETSEKQDSTSVQKIRFQALHDYCVRHGVDPGFEVKS
jgi:hypothetical protein